MRATLGVLTWAGPSVRASPAVRSLPRVFCASVLLQRTRFFHLKMDEGKSVSQEKLLNFLSKKQGAGAPGGLGQVSLCLRLRP